MKEILVFCELIDYFYRDDVEVKHHSHLGVSVGLEKRKQHIRMLYDGDLPAGRFLFSSRLKTGHYPSPTFPLIRQPNETHPFWATSHFIGQIAPRTDCSFCSE